MIFRPLPPNDGAAIVDVIVEVGRSALLVPGEYDVYPEVNFPKLPVKVQGPGPVIPSLAHISYDRNLQSFNIQVNSEGLFASGQFSVLVNLSDLVREK